MASPAPARAGKHTAHPLISTRRAEVAATGREEEREEKGEGSLLEWRSLAETARAPTSILLDDTAAKPQTRLLWQIRSSIQEKRSSVNKKSQSRARRITETIKFNAKALENMSMSCFFFPPQIERVGVFWSLSYLFEDTLKDYLLLV